MNGHPSPSISDSLVEVAESIVAKGLAVPAVFFLELHKPVATIASVAVTASEPLLSLFLKSAQRKKLSDILSSREKVEDLIALIEERM